MDLTVHVRGANRKRRGPIAPLAGSQAVLRYCGVGSWQMVLDRADPKLPRLVPGAGVLALDEQDEAVFHGPMTSPKTEASGTSPTRTVTVVGSTDELHLADRFVLPNPALAASAQTTDAYYVASGVAETVIRTLVNVQAGPGARVERRVAGLVLEANLSRGSTVRVNNRFKPKLAEQLATLATAGGVGWRIKQVGTDLVFQVYVPADLTRRVRFSRDLGNLGPYTHETSAPDITHVAVAGQGEGTARTIVERSNAAASTEWGRRIEEFQDRRDTNDTAQLQQAGDETLAENGPAAALSVSALDIPRMRYGVDYQLGDRVTVELEGVTLSDVVREVTLTWTPGGVRVEPRIGNEASPSREPKYVAAIRDLRKRTARLETR